MHISIPPVGPITFVQADNKAKVMLKMKTIIRLILIINRDLLYIFYVSDVKQEYNIIFK